MLERIYLPIKREMGEVEDVLRRELRSDISLVDSVSSFATENGGKRIRPAIFLLAARMSGAGDADLARIGAAIEMLHTASLLHDDVVDDAVVRRGVPSVRGRWDNKTSVLVGDHLWHKALKLIVDSGDGALVRSAVRSIGIIIRGELLEVSHQGDATIGADAYMEIIQGKTAELFSLAARAGAVVAGASGQFEDALSSYGFHVGQAFQLMDDLVDYAPGAAARGGTAAMGELSDRLIAQAKAALGVFRPSVERDALLAIADYVVQRFDAV